MKVSFRAYFTLPALLCIVIVALCVALMPIPARAHTVAIAHTHALAQGHVTIIVLDMSGSMEMNDHDGLRCSAANAYIDLSGPGDLIGVIGLDNKNNLRGGSHNFQRSLIWAQPMPMDTLRQRQSLQQTIALQSQHCHADNTTPTYDALNQALGMLTLATAEGQISGSVILLTDGEPDDGEPIPDTADQINAIKSELLPRFKLHHWPIDTVALGEDTGFHGFLSDLSNTTSGRFYDDGNGVVAGISPLNIAPFFVDIFARRNNRTLGPDIRPIQLQGGTKSRDFQLGDYVDQLDAIIIRDNPRISITLTAPGGQILPPAVAGTFVSTSDPHYAIFSIQGPQRGDWQLNVQGAGWFLMDSLVLSTLKVSIISPSARTPVLLLGERFTISAMINYQGSPVINDRFVVTARVAYVGAPSAGTNPFTQDIVLNDNVNPGIYQTQVIVPQTASPGSYDIAVSVSQVSNTTLASDHLTIRLELFPVPFFLAPQTNQPTAKRVDYTVAQWDPALQFLYSLPTIEFSRWPLQNLLVQPYVSLPGQVELNGKLYLDASVTVVVTCPGSNSTVPVKLVNDGTGHFRIVFPEQADGTYNVMFRTSGTFEDSHGDFGVTLRTVRLIRPISIGLDVLAWAATIPYIFLIFLIRFLFTPRPFGVCMESERGDIVERYHFNRSHRNLIQWFFRRNILYSQQVYSQQSGSKIPAGLKFRFRCKRKIEVRPVGKTGTYWKHGDGTELQPKFQIVRELSFRPEGTGASASSIYTIIPRGK